MISTGFYSWIWPTSIGVDLAGILGGTHGECRRWVGAKWGGFYGESLQPTRCLGERRELPQWGPWQSRGRKRILAFLKATERSFLYLYVRNLRGQFALASPHSKFWGTCLPRPPVIYAHADFTPKRTVNDAVNRSQRSWREDCSECSSR